MLFYVKPPFLALNIFKGLYGLIDKFFYNPMNVNNLSTWKRLIIIVLRGVCRMNNCVLCRRDSEKLVCPLCGHETSNSSCENCSVEDICVCRECYDKYRILRAIELFHDRGPFMMKEFTEKGIGTELFQTLHRDGFIKRYDFKGGEGSESKYLLSEKSEDFMELNMDFMSAFKSLLGESGVPSKKPLGGPIDPVNEKTSISTEPMDDHNGQSNEEGDYMSPAEEELDVEGNLEPGQDEAPVAVGDFELCRGCRSELETETERSQGICMECSRTLYALESLEEILQIFRPGDEFNLDTYTSGMDDMERTKFMGMTWIINDFNLLDYDPESGIFQLRPEEELQRFIIENLELKGLRPKKEGPVKFRVEEVPEYDELECSICGEKKPAAEFQLKEGEAPRCRECSRKCCAADALVRIRRLVEPGVEFTIDDILEGDADRTKLMGYIWILQDFDLIVNDYALETYTLKPDDELRAFHEIYGEGELATEAEMIRTCPICGRKLKKSSLNRIHDEERAERRECYDKIVAWEIFTSMEKVIGVDPSRRRI